MIEDVVEGVFRILGRFIGQVFIEIILELLIKGPGYFIARTFKKCDPDGVIVVVTGILFWVVVSLGVYSIYSSIEGGGKT